MTGVALDSVFSVLPDNLVDPVDVTGDAGVDSGVLLLGAPDPKGDYADLLARSVTVEQGAAAVTAAGVLAQLWGGCAYLFLGDLAARRPVVLVVGTLLVAPHSYVHLSQLIAGGRAGTGGPPTGDLHDGVDKVVPGLAVKADGLLADVIADFLGEGENGDVVEEGVDVEALVPDDALHCVCLGGDLVRGLQVLMEAGPLGSQDIWVNSTSLKLVREKYCSIVWDDQGYPLPGLQE